NHRDEHGRANENPTRDNVRAVAAQVEAQALVRVVVRAPTDLVNQQNQTEGDENDADTNAKRPQLTYAAELSRMPPGSLSVSSHTARVGHPKIVT
ncbi:MAG: hypothetical protein QOH29_806, partial [Actinomycetota bacterium]|nr:hypothetical protein [Actinomycetota bacterium]